MIENIQMEQFADTSANGLRTQPLPPKNPGAQRISKKGGARFSFMKRTSEKSLQQKNSKLKNTTPGAFQKANWDLAVSNTKKKMNRYYKGEEVGIGVDLEHFKIYGSGIYLFFSFLKSVTVVFGLMSIVELIPIIYNYAAGGALSNMTVSLNYYFAKTTIANFSPSTSSYPTQDKLMNVICDMICIFLFISFYFFWLKRGNELTEEVRKEVKLRSYTVVEVIDPPPKVTEAQIYSFMSQFGKVVQVAAVKDYDQSINLSKKIFDLEVEVKELQLQFETEADPKLEIQIKQKKQNIDEVYKELVLYQDDIKEETLKYYVSFSTIEERENAIKTLEPYKARRCDCCSDDPPQHLLLGGQRVQIEACHTEPGEIIWENQHVTWKTRWIRALVQFICLVLVIVIGFLGISFLNILAPSATTTVDTSTYTSTTILSVTNTTIAQSWCITNQGSVLSDTGSTVYSFCWSYIQKYYIKIAITIGIAFGVIIVKAIIKVVVVYLAKFQRYKSHTEQSKDITQNLLITYLCTTVLITFLLQALIGNISFKNSISLFINSSYLNENLSSLSIYADFVSEWYSSIGYQICLTWVIMIIYPSLTMPFVHFLKEAYAYWKAEEEEIQAKMEKRMEPMQFQIEDNYANILMIVFVSLGFSAGIPLMTVVTFFALLSRYLYLKYIFIRYCKIPKTYDEALDLKTSGLLPYGVMIHFMFGIWMFGVTTIFNSDSSTFDSWVNNLNYAFLKQIGFLLARILGTWYYSIFFFVVLALFFFKLIIFNLIAKSFMKDSKDISVVQIRSCGSGSDELFNRSTKDICNSYKIENNPDYTEVLSIMHKKRKFVVRVKDMEST